MLCEECRVNEASFTVSVVAGEETTVRHLCADCMSKMNSDIMKGNVRSLLNTVLNVIKATADTETRKEFSMPIFGRFTQRAQQTLLLAQKIAAELQQPYVGTEHLLLALLKSNASVPKAVSARMTYESVTEELQKEIAALADPEAGKPAGGRIELSPRAKKTLETSVLESHKLGQNYVTVEHFWLALLGNDDGVAGGLLRRAGVDLSAAREEILRQMRENAGNEGPARQFPGMPPFAPARGRQGSAGDSDKSILEKFSRDLTAAAEKNELEGDPADHPDPDPAHEEQPGPDRRARRGQERRGGGPGPADRAGQRAGAADRQAGAEPGHGQHGRGDEVPRRV